MNDILVVGASGMLGRSWTRLLSSREIAHRALTRDELDVTNAQDVERAITPETDWVINCAAWTDVDSAEAHVEESMAVNGHAVGSMARRCSEVDAKLVHYSTDYVFSGRAHDPYRHDDRRTPIGAYGRGKALGEELLEKSGAEHLLIRTSWLYAPWGKNFVLTMRDLVHTRETLRVVNDQRGRPSSCQHIAESTLSLIDRDRRGVYHICDGGDCTWFELASWVRDVVGSSCTIDPCTTDEFPRAATRPSYSVLDLGRTEEALGEETPGWKARVAEVLAQLEGR